MKLRHAMLPILLLLGTVAAGAGAPAGSEPEPGGKLIALYWRLTKDSCWDLIAPLDSIIRQLLEHRSITNVTDSLSKIRELLEL